jgi:hypothetical protein
MIWRRSFTLGGTLWRTVRGRSGAVVVQDQRCRRKEIQIETGWVRTLAKSFASPPPELMMGRLDWDSCVCVSIPLQSCSIDQQDPISRGREGADTVTRHGYLRQGFWARRRK